MHHVSIRTSDIHRAIAFYELFGFSIEQRFTTGITLACWLTGWGSRLELIQIPEPKPAPDAFGDEHYVGYYHLSFDVTEDVDSLPEWLNQQRSRFQQAAEQNPAQISPLTVLLEPTQQMIGETVYEVTFIADADGLPLEIIRQQGKPS